MSELARAFASHQRRSWLHFMRSVLDQCTDVERAMHRVRSQPGLTYAERSALLGRVRYLMVRAEMRGENIDIEAQIARELKR